MLIGILNMNVEVSFVVGYTEANSETADDSEDKEQALKIHRVNSSWSRWMQPDIRMKFIQITS